MAELTVFNYWPGTTILHRTDIRCKIIMLLVVNLLVLKTSPIGLVLTSFFLILLLRILKITFKTVLLNLRLFFLIFLFIILARSLSIQGDPVLSIGEMQISRQGLMSGMVYSWRLLIMLFTGIIFISSAKGSTIKAGIQWFLKPLPFIPEKRIAVMISLMLRFLPLILHQAEEISEAQKARAVEKVKNPVKRLTLYSLPLMRRIFETADSLALAMESRCYSENRTDPQLEMKRSDLILLLLLLPGFAFLMICL